MIARLKGIVDHVGDDHVVIDVGGVGYLVFCSGRTLSRLGEVGTLATLEIETHVREDHIHLYGFADLAERDLFRLLQTVQSVGARLALQMLSALSRDDILRAIAADDLATLSRAQGVGRRLAQRIASELKEKVGAVPLANAAGTAEAIVVRGGPSADAISALVNLGYRKAEAEGAVARAAARAGEAASVEALITQGLKELGR